MLQSIHDKITGWVAYVVLGAIALVFVFWGINWTLGAPSYAAKVNGNEIPLTEIRQAYQQELAKVERSAGGPIDENQRNAIKQRVLDDFVGSEAVITRVDSLGYRVSDADLLKAMSQVPAFQVEGKYDPAYAVAVLKAQGRSIPEIESIVRRDVQLRQLDAAMGVSSFTTDAELKQMRALTRQQRELAWVTVPAAHYAEGATPDEAAVKAYYAAHKTAYLTPETVDLHYVEISLAQLASTVTVTDAQLKSYFEEQKTKNPQSYTQAEQRRVRHILFTVTDPKSDAAVKAKAEAVLKRAQAGEDFSKLAKEFSQDPGSAPQGGDLGWSERKVWVAPFAEAAYAMKVDEIRGPVKTQFGYHLLKLDGIKESTTKTFEQSRGDIEAEYRRNEAERLFNNLQDKLADAALQNATDIDVVARKAGLKVLDIPAFSRDGGGGALGKAPKVLEAAFSADVLDGRLSPIVEVEKGRGVVLRAMDHKLPRQKPLDTVRADIVAAWKKQRGIELALSNAQAAAKRLQGGESWESVAKSLNGTAQAPRFVGRADAAVPPDIRQAAFEVPKPAAGKPEYQAIALAGGDAAVFGLSAVREDPTGDQQRLDFDLRRQYAQRQAAAEGQSYAAASRADAKIALNPQAID
jgi:peptidyl-prolyl cis-trans isomerase D